MKRVLKTALIGLLVLTASISVAAQPDYFTNWPAGRSPKEIGKQLAEHFIPSPHLLPNYPITYSEVGTWYGALHFAELTQDKDLRDRLIARFEPLMPGGTESNLVPTRDHVDFSIFGTVPLEISILTKSQRHLQYGLKYADLQWENPLPDGLSHQTRYWIDDMYMLTILQLEAFRATGDHKYLDRAAVEMVAYLDKLQQPNGLFYHAPDVPYFWGRGDGWVAAGMTEMLTSIPMNHPQRARILAGYRLMMSALLKYQGADGMWRQLLDQQDAWNETSSTGMFTYAFVTGVKKGWLDGPTYGPAARRGWIAVTGFIDQNGDMTSVCEGTNKFNDRDYYLARKRRTGDFHGQEPVLWAASALLE